jgi:hypothetical protein
MALVLAETAAGGAALLFLTPLWGEVRRGFFYLTGGVVLALALAAAAAVSVSYEPVLAAAGRLSLWLTLAVAGSTLLWLALLVADRPAAGRVVGVATVPLAVAMLIALARLTDEGLAVSSFQLLAGAAFTGAVLDGLLLGHWYLTDRRLSRGPINRMTWLLFGGVALAAAGVVVGFGMGGEPGSPARQALNPVLSLSASASWIALGMVLITGLIAVFIRLALRGPRPSAVQAATGFFYLAVITSFTGEIAAKIRFLP